MIGFEEEKKCESVLVIDWLIYSSKVIGVSRHARRVVGFSKVNIECRITNMFHKQYKSRLKSTLLQYMMYVHVNRSFFR
jgi:hypothetical protein